MESNQLICPHCEYPNLNNELFKNSPNTICCSNCFQEFKFEIIYKTCKIEDNTILKKECKCFDSLELTHCDKYQDCIGCQFLS